MDNIKTLQDVIWANILPSTIKIVSDSKDLFTRYDLLLVFA